ncbi:hypothetical protein [Myceligenerans crystallogenes]|uniref:hypothetical protein n=1 Tax=Myceligenerans crystallogenes TaxID=316335 RepID=UPI0031D0DF2C
MRTEFFLLGERAVLVSRRLAKIEGSIRIEPGAQVTFSLVDDLWPGVARTLPDVPQLRAPASEAAGTPDRELDLPEPDREALLARETFALQVTVEAWPDSDAETPKVLWARHWSVADDRLLDVRAGEGTVKLVERPAGSVAAELRWALVGAMDATAARAAESH